MLRSSRSRRLAMTAARISFAVVACLFGYLAVRDDWPGFWFSIRQSFTISALWAVLCVIGGVLLLGFSWLQIMAQLNQRVPLMNGLRIFFIGQLGKYIPGSIWALGAQGVMARSINIPFRVTVSAGLLLIYWCLATATTVAVFATAFGYLSVQVPPVLLLATFLVAGTCVAPAVQRFVYSKISGSDVTTSVNFVTTSKLCATLLAVWTLFGVSMMFLLPKVSLPPTGILVVATTGAFALAYVVGVVTFVAPAGLGAREAVLIALAQPVLGLTTALALASVVRVIHVLADFLLAGVAWVWYLADSRRIRHGTSTSTPVAELNSES